MTEIKRKNKKILVSGGAGYLGTVLVKNLLARGYDVRVLDAMVFPERHFTPYVGAVELLRGDIRGASPSIMKDVDAVIHLAGLSTDPTSQYDPRLTDMINHIAAVDFAHMAKSSGVKRFVQASTCSVYFTIDVTVSDPILFKESDAVNPISCYSLTKRCVEQALLDMADENFHPVILRKGTLYGFSPRMRYDLVFNSFAKDAFFKKVLTVDAGGAMWRPMIDIQDAVSAYIASLEMPPERVGGRIFNVATQNVNIGELANQIKYFVNKEKGIELQLDIKPPRITRNYKADLELFKSIFGLIPSRSMQDAFFEIWNHLEKDNAHNPYSDAHYNDRWYQSFFKQEEGRRFKKYAF